MKKLLFALWTAAALLSGCGASEPSVAYETAEGRFLRTDTGTEMILLDSGAATMSAEGEDSLFDAFTDGDRIRIYFTGGLAESYPMQIHHIHKAELLEEGTWEDLPQDELDSLTQLGWTFNK
ncbi:MAG: hypothetical protein IJ496_00220 [Ruminococcus sp.]|nr:hypothetical protein [Ruminococcus sp.]